ncbi:hypothetical protein D3C81_645210 [compost metagenome]
MSTELVGASLQEFLSKRRVTVSSERVFIAELVEGLGKLDTGVDPHSEAALRAKFGQLNFGCFPKLIFQEASFVQVDSNTVEPHGNHQRHELAFHKEHIQHSLLHQLSPLLLDNLKR